MNLEDIQRTLFEIIRLPLTPSERMRKQMEDGRSVGKLVRQIVKPNDRLTSVERLEIYNRVYWFRLLSSLAEDFPGLRAISGQRKFDKLLTAYLIDHPSQSFSLRDLGAQMETWLRDHPEMVSGKEQLAIDMARLEWADIEAFDSVELPVLTGDDLGSLGDDPTFHLQPYLRLLDLEYPVDRFLLKIRRKTEQETDIVSNVSLEYEHSLPVKRFALPKPKKVYLAVHRQELTVYYKRLEPDAFALLRALQKGATVSEAIAESVSVNNGPVDDVVEQLNGWFANWSSLGWFCKPMNLSS